MVVDQLLSREALAVWLEGGTPATLVRGGSSPADLSRPAA
jgi:hypothetical protein